MFQAHARSLLCRSLHRLATEVGESDVTVRSVRRELTVEGLTEADVCIGDIWNVGYGATVQVSQPRQPCWKLARRWRIKTLALQVQESGRTGWYFRVLIEGLRRESQRVPPQHAGRPSRSRQMPHRTERALMIRSIGQGQPQRVASL